MPKHIILTSHPAAGGKNPQPIVWGAPDAETRGPIVGTPREKHCDACFTGDYPLGDHESANGKFALEDIAVVPASR